MKKQLLAAAFALTAFAGFAQDEKIEGFSHPESVVSNGKFLFVNNMGEKVDPTNRDGDGTISKYDAVKKTEISKDFITGLNAPKGMIILKDVLYVADIDQIRGFKIKDGKEVVTIDLGETGSSFLNDIVAIDDKTLIVSSTDQSLLYKVNLKEKTKKYEELEVAKMPKMGLNGLAYDEATKTLYVVGYGSKEAVGDDTKDIPGEIGSIKMDAAKLTYKRIGKAAGQFDGIWIMDAKYLVVTDWRGGKGKGVVMKVERVSGKATDMTNYGMYNGPADIFVDVEKAMIYLPDLLGDSVFMLKWDPKQPLPVKK